MELLCQWENQKIPLDVMTISEFIGVNETIAEQDACRIEHVMSKESVRAVCLFANYENMYYERRIRNSELTDRYLPGVYTFVMQMYSMELCHLRKLAKEWKLHGQCKS